MLPLLYNGLHGGGNQKLFEEVSKNKKTPPIIIGEESVTLHQGPDRSRVS